MLKVSVCNYLSATVKMDQRPFLVCIFSGLTWKKVQQKTTLCEIHSDISV